MKRALVKAAMLACVAALATGCAGGIFKSDNQVPDAYHLRPGAGAAFEALVPADIVVLRPFTRPGLESDRIVVWLPDRRLDAYANNHWTSPLPDMVQSLLLDEMRARGGWQNVLLDRGEFRGQYVLQTEIRDFQAEYAAKGEAPLVRVTLRGELGRAPSRAPLATVVGSAEVRASADRMTAVIVAFEQAYAQAADKVVTGIHDAARAPEKATIPATPPRETAR